MWTDIPAGQGRPRCSACGEHRWAFDGYCLGTKCAGPLDHPDYPQSKPDHLRQQQLDDAAAAKPVRKKPGQVKVKMPRKGTRRSTELWYEAQGKVAPWLEHQKPEGS